MSSKVTITRKMASSSETVVKTLKTKVEQLMQIYTTTLEINAQQAREIASLKEEMQLLEQNKEALEQELQTVRVAGALEGSESSEIAKRRIGQLVREIDRCIALLSN